MFQIIFYVIIWVIIILNTIFVTLLIKNIKKLNIQDDVIDKYISKLKLFPIIQILSVIPATVNRIIAITMNGKIIFELMMLQIICDSLTGLVYSIIYGFNPNVKSIINDFFEDLFKKKDIEIENLNDENNKDSRISTKTLRKNTTKRTFDDRMITNEE